VHIEMHNCEHRLNHVSETERRSEHVKTYNQSCCIYCIGVPHGCTTVQARMYRTMEYLLG
jgi:hypothetical protein